MKQKDKNILWQLKFKLTEKKKINVRSMFHSHKIIYYFLKIYAIKKAPQ